jgi:hypothetical protein
MRSMAWQCICEGASGLVFYSFFDIRRGPDVPFEEQWERVKRVAAEIKQWAEVLLSVEKPPAVRVRGEGIHWLAKRHQGKGYLFVVNEDYTPAPFTVEMEQGRNASLRRLSDGQVLRPAQGRISDRLEGLEMRVYEVSP